MAQGIVGCLIASMVPLSIVGDVLQPLAAVHRRRAVGRRVSSLLGWLMTRWQMLPGTTALWGTSPGAASVMTIMAESYGADVRLVAFMQYLRVVLVAVVAAAGGARCSASSAAHAPPPSSGSRRSPGCRWRDPGAGDRRPGHRPPAAHPGRRLPGAAGAAASCSRISA